MFHKYVNLLHGFAYEPDHNWLDISWFLGIATLRWKDGPWQQALWFCLVISKRLADRKWRFKPTQKKTGSLWFYHPSIHPSIWVKLIRSPEPWSPEPWESWSAFYSGLHPLLWPQDFRFVTNLPRSIGQIRGQLIIPNHPNRMTVTMAGLHALGLWSTSGTWWGIAMSGDPLQRRVLSRQRKLDLCLSRPKVGLNFLFEHVGRISNTLRNTN